MKYVFQLSKIWEAGNPVDSTQPEVKVKVPDGSSLARALKKIDPPELGRVWVHIRTEY